MGSTTFNTGTIITKEWLQDINDFVYNFTSGTTTALDVANVPAGNLSATNIQDAINELDLEKQPVGSYAASGVNSDITSLASPAIGSATATTQTAGDNSTKVATTAYADAAVAANQARDVPVRQTVLSGPVDSSGFAAFGGATGSTTVTASGTLIASAANGFSSSGSTDRVGSITNPAWTGLSTNGTMFMYLDIASNGTCTTGSTTLAPVYQHGGTYSTTNGQFTFNIQEMVGKVGDGSTAAQTWRVFVGEVTVASGVVSAITWYALRGRYQSQDTVYAPWTPLNFSHNIGTIPLVSSEKVVCVTAEFGYAVGHVVDPNFSAGSASGITGYHHDRNNRKLLPAGVIYVLTPSSGMQGLVAGNWKLRVFANRGW